ncbi:hypothetical protein HNR65_000321 [Desulfosalsimonas propionicica]|uniref:Flippase-like domain-containing protein n=1 Tax=Desulfosalsimonas propionicica TaxID=332175 RepID=A0A7W0C6E2_9BACT|nr:hypothetical protein [Desulfosalsimonas propionicica]MBA2880014.1 hypothetical protein [Desulfosalsimonas propionicica]
MKPSLKTWLQWAGTGLGLAGVIFIGIRLYQYSGDLDFDRFGTGEWAAVLTLAFVYGCANFLLAAAWWNILSMLRVRADKSWSIRIYGVSQLAKYIPGNIFQFAGRQALGVAAEVPGWALAKSIFWELAFISTAGLTFSCLIMPSIFPGLSVGLSLTGFLAVILAAGLCLRSVLGASAAKAFSCHLLFLFLSGLVFVATLAIVTGKNSNIFSFEFIILYAAAYVVAWLAGLVTPGAPAGVGIREMVLLFLLGAEVAQAELLVAVILNRLITVTGDGGFFVWASYKNVKAKSD